MERFFLFSLPRLTSHEGHRHDDEDTQGDEDEGGEFDQGEYHAWERRMEQHELVRLARDFRRACAVLEKRSRAVPVKGVSAAIMARGVANQRLANVQGEIRHLRNYTKRLPETLIEALAAEVSGSNHRGCERDCVGYDIEWLERTETLVERSVATLEHLLGAYPERRREILPAIEQGRLMDAALSRRMIDAFSIWLGK